MISPFFSVNLTLNSVKFKGAWVAQWMMLFYRKLDIFPSKVFWQTAIDNNDKKRKNTVLALKLAYSLDNRESDLREKNVLHFNLNYYSRFIQNFHLEAINWANIQWQRHCLCLWHCNKICQTKFPLCLIR